MFTDAVKKVSRFTRPIMFISRSYKSEQVIPGAATMFFVNDKGTALTTRHVAEEILQAEKINQRYGEFRQAQMQTAGSPKDHKAGLRKLEKDFGYRNGTRVNLKVRFLGAVTPIRKFTIHLHPEYDLAILQFEDFESLNYVPDDIALLEDESYLSPGRSLCRLGYPFPEFSNFTYDKATDQIHWTDQDPIIPSFPIDGIMTRRLGDANGRVYGIEMSTPGLRGQSGGPLFDTEGRICGLQFATHHLPLGFDPDGTAKLHVGMCVGLPVIKAFLDGYGIPYRTR